MERKRTSAPRSLTVVRPLHIRPSFECDTVTIAVDTPVIDDTVETSTLLIITFRCPLYGPSRCSFYSSRFLLTDKSTLLGEETPSFLRTLHVTTTKVREYYDCRILYEEFENK